MARDVTTKKPEFITMKITIVSCGLLISSFFIQVLSLPERIILGGLFDIGDDEEEFAFRLAVDRINADITMLPRSTLVAHMERLDRYDNFRATKK
ncbi:glutamate receptor ionotropic, kainate 3-like, partial [Limulus polyphemus]|uniref:Glutamate receptor ionotropic, kainate 3-like n=1 Tax=Limulus polyphemus TaxID=6850 RepID=A0ABM1BVX7_LIMPO